MANRSARLFTIWLVLCAFVLWPFSRYAHAADPKKKEPPPKIEGRLIVEDTGALFGLDAVKRASRLLAEVKDSSPRNMNVVTYKDLPDRIKKGYDAATKPEERNRLFSEWAREEARGSRGLFVLICANPPRIQVIADKQIRDAGFSEQDEKRVLEMLLDKFRESSKVEKEAEKAALRDKGLILSAEYVRNAYKKISK